MTANTLLPAERLTELAQQLLELSHQNGASQAQVNFFQRQGLTVHMHRGRAVSRTRELFSGFDLTVYQGKRTGRVSSTRFSTQSLEESASAANAIARHTEEDPAVGLAEPELLCSAPRQLDLYHPWDLDETAAIDIARRLEAGVESTGNNVQSDGAYVETGHSYSLLANSNGFLQGMARSAHSLSSVAIARDADNLAERDFWWDSACDAHLLPTPESIGQTAGASALAYLDKRPQHSVRCPVLFAPQCAVTLIEHLVEAISGQALYLESSFMQKKLGQSVMANHLDLHEDPFIALSSSSLPYDADGIEPSQRNVVEGGVLHGLFLSLYSARRLGRTPTGNGSGPGNLLLRSRFTTPQDDPQQMLAKLGTGLLVTSLAGHGFQVLTGDYSRSARGFWVNNGVIQHAVTGITISGNLGTMLLDIAALGADTLRIGNVTCGSLLIDNLQVSGQ